MIIIHCFSHFIITSIVFCLTQADVPFAKRKTGRECIQDSDCVTNAYCHEGRLCLCKDRFIAINTSKETFICVNEASYIGDICSYDVQCTSALGTYAECKRKADDTSLAPGRCRCKINSHYQDGICYKNSRIGESCQVHDNCFIKTPHIVAYCDQSRCVCPPYYYANNNGTDCLPSSDLGGPCKIDGECITMNSRCSNVCECKMGYVMNEKKSHCLIAADKLHAPCDEDQQCTEFLPRTRCDPLSNRCNCIIDAHEVGGACFKSSKLHGPCSKKEECLIDSRNISRVECYQGFCICSNNYEMVNRTDCVDTRRTLPDTEGKSTLLQTSLQLILVINLVIRFL